MVEHLPLCARPQVFALALKNVFWVGAGAGALGGWGVCVRGRVKTSASLLT